MREMRRLFNVPEDVKTRLWIKRDFIERLNMLEHTVLETGIFENENQLILLEKQIFGMWLGSGE